MVDKKQAKTFKLNEVNDLQICVFVVKRNLEHEIVKDIEGLSGKILSVVPALGVSHSSVFEVVSAHNDPSLVIFVAARTEDSKNLIAHISLKYSLYQAGNGRAFAIDADGYLGAKALFL